MDKNTESQSDARLDWIAHKVQTILGIPEAKWQKMLAIDDNKYDAILLYLKKQGERWSIFLQSLK